MSSTLTDKFLKELKETIEEIKVTQKELSEEIGVSQQRLHDWLKRLHNPNAEHILRIQKFLKENAKKGYSIVQFILVCAIVSVFMLIMIRCFIGVE